MASGADLDGPRPLFWSTVRDHFRWWRCGSFLVRTTIFAFAILFILGLSSSSAVEAAPASASSSALAAVPGGGERTNPTIELVTMGAGSELVHRWGHAALCVVHEGEPQSDVCFNYGAAIVKSVSSLAWNFLRGTARFMVIVQTYRNMLEMYRGWDRTVWVQRMPYTQAQVDQMVGLLRNDLRKENRSYVYHHMWDNCATRLRNHIDKVAGGALRKGGDKSTGMTFRDAARRGLAGRPVLLMSTTLGLGRGLDQEVTEWASMAHPDYLRAVVAKKLGAKPRIAYVRQGKPFPKNPGYGHGILVALALLLGLGVVVTRRLKRYERAATISATVVLTFLGSILWLTAILTAVPELYINEALLIFWPTDFLLLKLSERHRQIYLRVRIGALAIVSALLVLGVLVQPLLTAVLIPLITCLALFSLPIWPPKQESVEQSESQSEPQAKSKPKSKSKARPKSKPKSKSKVRPKSKPKSKPRSKAKRS